MKKTAIMLSIILCCIIFAGAARQVSPVLPTKGFYVNDYANVINKTTRESLLSLAYDINEKTGADVVVLTVPELGGLAIDQYAKLIFEGWDIGGTAHDNGVLILVDTSATQISMTAGSRIKDISDRDKSDIQDKIKAKNYSEGITLCFAAYENQISRQNGLEPMISIDDIPKSPKGFFSSKESVAALGLMVLILLRVWRVGARTRKRYTKNYHYRHKTFTNPYSRTGARHDDGDYPSGFGGFGNRVVIRGEESEKLREDDGNDEKDNGRESDEIHDNNSDGGK